MNVDGFSSGKYCYLSCRLWSRQAFIILIIAQLLHGSISPTKSANITSTYTNKLSADDPIFLRPNATSGNYYYQAIQVRVLTSGMYVFKSASAIDTFGCLYNDYFNPRYLSQNLIITNDDGSNNLQFLINASLQNGRNYVLVVTTFAEVMLGDFSIEVNGPDTLNMTSSLPSTLISSTMTTQTATPVPSEWSYTGSLTWNDRTFVRPNGNGSAFYYKTIRISIFQTGVYTLVGSSSINIYGVLYNNSFSPSSPTRNILASNYNTNASPQFTTNVWLQSGGTYILVVTSYTSGDRGDFWIIATGSSRPYFDLITPTTTTYSSFLILMSPTFARPGGDETAYYYKAIAVTVPLSGTYTLSSSSIIDSYGILYNNLFDPASPNGNMIVFDDDGNGNRQFKITVNLQPRITYVLIFTTFNKYERGDFLVVANGPAQATLSVFEETPVAYSGILSSSSPQFFRPSGRSGYYYYQALELTVSTSGTYTVKSESTTDMYGCLYDYSFDPSYPSSWLSCDDDSAGRRQFLINYYLQATRTYILVVTTFSPIDTGYYTIRANGPALLSLTATTRSTRFPLITSTSCSSRSCRTNDGSHVTKIVGITIGSLCVLLFLFSICTYKQKQTAASNQNRRTQNVRRANSRVNTTGSNRVSEPFTISLSSMNNAYMEQLPPSYESYMASLKKPNQETSPL